MRSFALLQRPSGKSKANSSQTLAHPGLNPDRGASISFSPVGWNFGQLRIYPRDAENEGRNLLINKPGDEYERQADHIAEQVMRDLEPLQLQRTCACNEASPTCGLGQSRLGHSRVQAQPASLSGNARSTASAIVDQVVNSPGQPLSSSVRANFEPRFGHDFSQVRIHTDAQAEVSAKSMAARAYTVGRDIVFGAEQYRPHTVEGGRLLAHELAHVLQQRDAGRIVQRAEVDDNPELCFPADGRQPLQDVSGVLNTWIAEAQAYGRSTNLDVPTAIYDQFATLADPLTTVVEQRIFNLPRNQVRYIAIEDSRYSLPQEEREFYRRMGKTPLAPVINLCGVCVGSDKIGHFFQQGGEYFRIGEAIRERLQDWTFEERAALLDQLEPGVFHSPIGLEDQIIELYTREYGKWLEGFPNRLPEAEVAWLRVNNLIPTSYFSGVLTPRSYREGFYGRLSSGVLSRADLEANRQGGHLYRTALQNPDAPLDICQYVNYNWNEYYNPNSYVTAGRYRFKPISGPELPIAAPDNGPILVPGEDGFTTTIPFDTGSDYPDDTAMEALTSQLLGYGDILRRGEYYIDCNGYASRVGDDRLNQDLSERRAQSVKGRLQYLLGLAIGDLNFELLASATGYGEQRAREVERRPDTDDSPSDRVVEVVFEIRRQ
jgi:outer membrane protein OmpA-like peptidoglycan-associated protein